MKVQWNKVTWYSKLVAVMVGIAIWALGIAVGMRMQEARDALRQAARSNMDIERLPVRNGYVPAAYMFDETGEIRNMASPDVEGDRWVITYGDASGSAVTRGMYFTTESRCMLDGVLSWCDTSRIAQGDRMRVRGTIDGDKVRVDRMDRAR